MCVSCVCVCARAGPLPPEQTPFDEIARALREYGAHPVTLRFERYPQVGAVQVEFGCDP
jgi:hypothetical protein